jgi:hypothetical protein
VLWLARVLVLLSILQGIAVLVDLEPRKLASRLLIPGYSRQLALRPTLMPMMILQALQLALVGIIWSLSVITADV